MEVWDYDFALQNMNDVRIVPHALGCQRCTTDTHAIERIVPQLIILHQRTEVTDAYILSFVPSRGSSVISNSPIVERIRIDTDRCRPRHGVVANDVIEDHRLASNHEDRGGLIHPACIAIGGSRCCCTGQVVFNVRIRYPQ